MAESAGWSLTESDPGVMTGILHDLGVQGVHVEELWGLDSDLLRDLEPVYALVFLFKWVGNADPATMDGTFAEPTGPHYFAHQVINNACASIALLNATLNIQDPEVRLGDELANLKAFSEGLDPETRGWTLSNSEKLREVHNSFARSDPFHLEDHQRPDDLSEDAYHFIAYLPIGDELYELDGLKPKPVSLGKIPSGAGESWTDLAKSVLERRIATYPAGEVMFNLMALTGRKSRLERQLHALEQQQGAEGAEAQAVQERIGVQDRLAEIEERMKDWETENALRRHNYIGLVHALLVELGKQHRLAPQIEAAKLKMKERVAERRAKGGRDAMMMEED